MTDEISIGTKEFTKIYFFSLCFVFFYCWTSLKSFGLPLSNSPAPGAFNSGLYSIKAFIESGGYETDSLFRNKKVSQLKKK